MKQERKKGHHFIAQVHQRQFTDINGQIYVLSPRGEIFKTNPSNVFKESHYHTVKGSLKAEDAFGRLETELGKIFFDEINKQQPLPSGSRGMIAYYVAAMLFRPKLQKENATDFYKELLKKGRIFQGDIEKNPKNYIPEPNFTQGPKITLEDVEKMLDDYNSYHTLSTLRIMTDFGPLISSMGWILFVAPENNTFICSDNPLAMLSPALEKQYGIGAWGSHVGLSDESVQLTLALTSRIALYMGWTNKNLGYVLASPKQVDNINLRTARNSENLFANNQEVLHNFFKKYGNTQHDQDTKNGAGI